MSNRTPLQARQVLVGEAVDEKGEQQAARLHARVAQPEAENAKLMTEREILRSAAKNLPGDELVSRFQFVADHRNAFG